MKKEKDMNPQEEPQKPSGPEIDNTENEDIIDKSQTFIRKNRVLIIVALVVIVGAAAAMWYLGDQNEKASREAQLALSKIVPVYAQGNYDAALAGDSIPGATGQAAMGLREIADKYDGTIHGKRAALYAGNSFLSTDKYSEAKRYFEIAEAADSYLIKMGALAGLGAVTEYEENYGEAAKYYEKAAAIAQQDFVKQQYKYYAGYVYERAGQKDKAIEIYRDIVNTNEFSEFGGLAKSGLARLGTIIE